MNIEPAEEKHKEMLFAIHEICFRSQIDEIWGWDDASQRDYFSPEWDSSECRVLLERGEVIGYLMWRQESDHLYLQNISLLPVYQGKGRGKQAMDHVQYEADKSGGVIKLSTFRTNERVVKFYLDLGFMVIEEVETGLRMSRSFTM